MRLIRLSVMLLCMVFAVIIFWRPSMTVDMVNPIAQRVAAISQSLSARRQPSAPQSELASAPGEERGAEDESSPATPPASTPVEETETSDTSDESAAEPVAELSPELGLDSPNIPGEEESGSDTESDEGSAALTQEERARDAITGIPPSLRALGFQPAFATFPSLEQFKDATPSVLTSKFEDGPALSLVGGTTDEIVNVPWMVGVRKRRQESEGGVLATSVCGGAVFARRWVITAAHCLDDDYNVLEIIAGASDLDSENVIRRVSRRAFIHAGYERASLRDDVAIIALDQAMPPFIPDAPFPTSEQLWKIPSVERVIGRGFGVTENGFERNFLKKVELAVLEEGTGYRVIRVADPDGEVEGLCAGDSGSPVEGVIESGDNFIIGMVSFNESNGSGARRCSTPSFPAGVVSLEGYMKNIRALVNLCTVSPDICFGETSEPGEIEDIIAQDGVQ